ncbi:hypothetical protein CANDROIZ_270008 [Candidatus Roizmanbacteria bacterium]|nr:hypothetical protein CANDROIZ_270008 [Candidatus Roizmanbacteria bacterium]
MTFLPYTLSKRTHSATLPPLQNYKIITWEIKNKYNVIIMDYYLVKSI